MSDINEKIDSMLSSLNDSTSEINKNVQDLAKDITFLKNTILEETKSSYTEIKDSLDNLKRQVKDTEIVLDNLEKDEYNDRLKLNIAYFTTLVNMKNEIMNYDINNIDSIIDGLDEFDNTRTSFFNRVSNIFDETYANRTANENDVVSFVYNSMKKEIAIYKKYNELISDTLSQVKENVVKLSKFYIALYGMYLENIKNNQDEYTSKKNELLVGYTPVYELFNEKNKDARLFKDLSTKDNSIDEKYEIESEKLFNEFKELSSRQISHYESILSKELSLDSLFTNRAETMSKIKEDLINSPNKAESIKKIEKATDIDSLREVITTTYRKLNEDTYNKYRDLEEKLEKEYLINKAKSRNNHQLTRTINQISLEDSLIQNTINSEETVRKIDDLFTESMLDRIDTTYEYLINEERIIESIRNVIHEFNYSIDLINLSLSKDIETENITLEREVKLIKEDLEFSTSSYNYFYSTLYKEELKNIALLDYEIKLSRLHRNYITAKGILLISSNLYEKSRELDLLKPRYELKKIIDEYDVSRVSLEKALESEIKILDKTKARQEVTNITNYKYTMSYFEHRLLTASELIDMATKEYQLRIDVMNDIKNTYNSFDNYRIDVIIGKYLDKIKEMNEIKELDLNSLLQKIEYFSKDTDEDKLKNIERCNEILTGYKEMNTKIQKLMTSDPEIIYHEENAESFNEVIIDSFSTSQEIRDESLKEAFKSLYAVEEEFNAMVKNLDSIKTIDYTNAFNEYKLSYLIEMNRLNQKLDEMSTPIIENINDIATLYKDNMYKREYHTLNAEHERLTNEYYRSLLDRYSQIDTEDDLYPSENATKKDEYTNILNGIKLSSLNKEREILDIFNTNKDSLETNFKSKIKESNELSEANISNLKESSLSHKRQFLKDMRDYLINEKKTIKSFERINKTLKRKYSFEYYAFEASLKDKIKSIEKDTKEKYTNPSVYTLQGKK